MCLWLTRTFPRCDAWRHTHVTSPFLDWSVSLQLWFNCNGDLFLNIVHL
uniref:Uncharacterized protein n=1 Tax=Anopheles albimanus TaxID=7167 RepID=A0A182FYM6_ANOAL